MGILKKSGSWKTNKHNKHVKFGFEYYSTGEPKKHAKFCDGLSAQGREWDHFINMIFEWNVSPQNAWNCVRREHAEYVWELLLQCLDRYIDYQRFMSNPRGSRYHCYTISHLYERKVLHLDVWVNYCIVRYGYEYLEKPQKKISKYAVYNSYNSNDENDFYDENTFDDTEWDHLKRNCTRKPFEDILILDGGIEI